MKKFKIFGFCLLAIVVVNFALQGSKSQVLSQTGGVDLTISGRGCNAQAEFNPNTQVVSLNPGITLNANRELARVACVLRITTQRNDQILVPLSIKGITKNNGGKMTVAININSGANVLSSVKREYLTTGDINIANLFVPSESPQCGSSNIVGANINVYGTNAYINLNDIRFRLETKKC